MADETKDIKGDGSNEAREPLLDAHTTSSGIPRHEDLLPEHSSPDTTPTPSPSLALPTAPQGPFNDDIKNILKAIQLPERHDTQGKPSAAPRSSGEAKKFVPEDVPEVKIISETITPAAPKKEPAAPASVPPIAEMGTLPPTQMPSVVQPMEKVGTAEDGSKKNGAAKNSGVGSWIVAPLRTLREDLQHVVKDRKISIVRAVALEEDKKRTVPQLSPQEIVAKRRRRQRAFAFIFASSVLLLLGAAALVGVYTIQNQHTAPLAVSDTSSLIFSELSVAFPIQDQSSSDIKRVITQSQAASQASLGSITRIVPTLPSRPGEETSSQRLATTAEFLHALGTHAPDELVRALGDTFFLGIHTIDKNWPVVIVSVVSYDHAFAGMLAWEDSIDSDLAPIFPLLSPVVSDANGLPTARTFQDIVLRNYDVRALKDDSGTIQLYYSFPTPSLLIIAASPNTFTEVLSRLQAERKL